VSTDSTLDSKATSRTLIQRVRSHDAEAWDRLVALYAPFVFRHCRQARLPPEDAADVFQEVFQAAFAKISSFEKRREGDTFRGWLRTITRNKVFDHYRRQKRHPRGIGGSEIQVRMTQVRAPEEPDTDEETEQAPDAESLLFQSALESIRPCFRERTWRAFLGTVVDGRTPADVGEDLGMTPGAVRVAKSRVLQRLRTELGDLS
jgi:RNA polymerase sigma-70 factor (ECF subfamily)